MEESKCIDNQKQDRQSTVIQLMCKWLSDKNMSVQLNENNNKSTLAARDEYAHTPGISLLRWQSFTVTKTWASIVKMKNEVAPATWTDCLQVTIQAHLFTDPNCVMAFENRGSHKQTKRPYDAETETCTFKSSATSFFQLKDVKLRHHRRSTSLSF